MSQRCRQRRSGQGLYSISSSARAEQRRRQGDAKRSRRLEIDHQFEFGRLDDREGGGLFTLENAPGIQADLAIRLLVSVAGQPTGVGEFAAGIHCWDRFAHRQGDDLIAPALNERVGRHEQCTSSHFDHAQEGRVDIVLAAGIQDKDLPSKQGGGALLSSRTSKLVSWD